MSASGMTVSSLRLERAESSRLAWAFVVSLAIHLILYSGYQAGRKWHVWERVHLPEWMMAPRMLTELLVRKPAAKELEQLEKQRRADIPLTFIEVNPAQAKPEAPKAPTYYSDKNSLAANPDSAIQSTVPKIDGKQTDVPKTEDVPRTQAFPLQPAPPRAAVVQTDAATPKPQPGEEPKSNDKEEAKPKPALTPGDLAMALRQEPVFKEEGQADRPKKRARTVAELPAEKKQELAALTSGERMKQDGGVSTHDLKPSVDALATPFGDYDAALIYAVKRRWDDLLFERRFAGARTGKVVLRFHLNVDGTVTQMQLIDNTVDLTLALLCERAIRDPAPFARWPEELRREVGVNYREITFNFYYR